MAEDTSTCEGLLAVLVDPVCQGERCAWLCPEVGLCSCVQDCRFDLFSSLADFVTYGDIILFKIKCMVRCYREFFLYGEILQGNFIFPDKTPNSVRESSLLF